MSHTPPSPSSQPQKSILKKSSSASVHGTTTAGNNHVEPTRAKFDEMNVLETLHPPGKDYGHMKIDEPKTPYNYADADPGPSGGAAPPALDHKCLLQKLTEQAGAPPRVAKSLTSLSGEDKDSDGDSENDDPARQEFISKRKTHYNEFQAIQRARQLIQQEESDSDENKSDENAKKSSGKKK